MNAHQLDADGVIVNTIVVDSLDILPNLIDAAIGGGIGDRVVDGALVLRPLPAATVPDSVPMLDAHLVLISAGWMPAVRAYLDTMSGTEGEQARVYFDKALTMRRNHPLVLGIPLAIGKTEADVDALFIAAGALNA